MALANTGHSPDIKIHLEIDGRRIRLSDVLYDSATLFEMVEVAPNSKASLVFFIDGHEEREEIVLERGISKNDSMIKFVYATPGRINGREFSW